MNDQISIDDGNEKFWNEMCGSLMARASGSDGNKAEDIEGFDREFFDFYPYLTSCINFKELAGRDVLEIGLGYGSVSQRIALVANFTGLDIAAGPINWTNHRMRLFGLNGSVKQGSILDAPFEQSSFDAVISIGCLHHTGNIARALDEVHRVLRPGGRVTIMVYNACNYLRWITDPVQTASYGLASIMGSNKVLRLNASERARFDVNSSNEPAPETVLQTKSVLRRLLAKNFSHIEISRQNAHDHQWHRFHLSRRKLMPIISPLFGLDLYATATK